MIFARDKSQMCNNLLQFAHVYAWGREHNRRVISMRFSYKYPYFKIQHTPHTGLAWYLLAKYAAALKLLPTASFKHSDCDVKALEQKMLKHRHIVVSGWYARFYDLFLKYRDEIADLFSFEPAIQHHVEEVMAAHARPNGLNLGVHIRRGDYREWQGGKYYYEDEVFIRYIQWVVQQHPDCPITVYVCGNDPKLSQAAYQDALQSRQLQVVFPQGNPAEDLCLLSACDALIGPPSTFSLVASMYRDVPLCWMEQPEVQTARFRKFEQLFREIK